MEPARLAEETIRQSAVPKTVHQRCQQGGQRFFHTVFRVGFVPILLGLLEFCRDDFVSAEDRPSTPLLKAFVDEFVAIRPGESRFPKSFEMGDNSGQPDERPRHQVEMAHSFSIAKYEVPQNLYEAVMGTNPGRWNGPRNSVEMTSWDDGVSSLWAGLWTKVTKSQSFYRVRFDGVACSISKVIPRTAWIGVWSVNL